MLLAEHYREDYRKKFERDVRSFSLPAKNFLLDYGWPGNIRELKNMIKRAVLLCDDNEIKCSHFPLLVQPGRQKESDADAVGFPNLDEVEKAHIISAMQRAEGVKKKAAELLGVSRSTLDRKIQAYNIAI